MMLVIHASGIHGWLAYCLQNVGFILTAVMEMQNKQRTYLLLLLTVIEITV